MEYNIHLLVAISFFVIFLAILFFKKTRLLFRRTCKYFLYDNQISTNLRNKFLQIVLPGVSGAYFLCLDIWGDKWNFIKNYQHEHEFVFSVLIGTSLTVLIIRGTADWYEGKSDKSYIAFLERFSLLTTKLVTRKLERFKDESKKLKPNSNIFKQITQPKDQINLILGEIDALLHNNFGIKNKQTCITIMHQNPKTNNWYYEYETNVSWKHTKAQKLIDSKSAASECLKTGEPVFHACKNIAASNNEYLISDRDKRTGAGSVFCYPAFTETPDYRDNYIVSIVTYGKRLCDPLDKAQSEAISEIFSDICRRIDLELTLGSIKKWQSSNHINKARGAV